MEHGPELSGDSGGLVMIIHKWCISVLDLTGPISGGSPRDGVNLPPRAFSLHHDIGADSSSDVQIMIV